MLELWKRLTEQVLPALHHGLKELKATPEVARPFVLHYIQLVPGALKAVHELIATADPDFIAFLLPVVSYDSVCLFSLFFVHCNMVRAHELP